MYICFRFETQILRGHDFIQQRIFSCMKESVWKFSHVPEFCMSAESSLALPTGGVIVVWTATKFCCTPQTTIYFQDSVDQSHNTHMEVGIIIQSRMHTHNMLYINKYITHTSIYACLLNIFSPTIAPSNVP